LFFIFVKHIIIGNFQNVNRKFGIFQKREDKIMICRIQYLMEQNNITSSKLCSDLGLAKSSITDWKKGKAKPSVEALIKISRYFNVSLDWLITGKEYEKKISDEELEILEIYNRLDSEKKAEARGFIKGLLAAKTF
jgi:transcriptional regulator with XRE-family HTH domain